MTSEDRIAAALRKVKVAQEAARILMPHTGFIPSFVDEAEYAKALRGVLTTVAKARRTDWKKTPYTAIVVPGAGTEDGETHLSPVGGFRIRLAVQRWRRLRCTTSGER